MKFVVKEGDVIKGHDNILNQDWELSAGGILVPIYSWCERPEKTMMEQLIKLAKLPFLFSHIGEMADGHPGYGMPIGGVIATHGVLLPYCVGNDIGCFTGDTEIALLDGTTKTFKEQLNKEFWIYSISDDNMIIPGFAKCVKTRDNSELVEVIIDNDEIIRCTPDQLFKLRNGGYKEAQKLEPGDSLMPLYISYQKRDGYEILHNPDNHHTLTHKVVAEFKYGTYSNNLNVHHLNKNKHNNTPENITLIDKTNHSSLHGKDQISRLQSKKFKQERLEKLRKNGFYDKKYYHKKREVAIKNINEYMNNNSEEFKETVKYNGQRGKKYLIDYNRSEKGRLKSKEIANRFYKCDICNEFIKSPIGLYNHKKKHHNNHKVVSVRFLKQKEDVYCLQVKNKFRNFALASGIFVHNCGMTAVGLNYLWENLNPEMIDRIMRETMRVIPHGKGIWHRQPQPWDKFDDAPEFPLHIKSVLDDAKYQLGTLGSGNHFIELLKGDNKKVWLMIHSGSRNLGVQICNEFWHQARRLNEIWKIQLPDPQLAYLPIETKEGKQYFEMMNFALDFAKESRSRMMTTFMSIACGMLGCDAASEPIDIHHNFARFENHYGKNVIVHRKGATPAFRDQYGIIPGSMATPSYIVRGKGCRESFCTVSHGAGRTGSRKYARGKFKQQEIQKQLEGIWMNIYNPEEDPRCYKNIDDVISAQSDLVDTVVKMEPLGVIIGSERREFKKKRKKK